MELKEMYKAAAKVAMDAGVKSDNQDDLVAWIRSSCTYRPDTEFFLVLGIGCELADLEAQAQGYDNEVHRAFEVTMSKPGMKEKHEIWLKYKS